MHESETRALRRTALLLFAVSAVRFVWPVGAVVPDVEEVTDSLLATSQERLADAERRSRPLELGERIDPNLAFAQELDRMPRAGARGPVADRRSAAGSRVHRTAPVPSLAKAPVRPCETQQRRLV